MVDYEVVWGEWWNGRHTALKMLWAKTRVGSTPTSPIFYFLKILTTSQPEKIPTMAPAKISEGQWTPTKTREIEIKKLATKNPRLAPHQKLRFDAGQTFLLQK